MTTTDNGMSWTFGVTVSSPRENSSVYAIEYDANGAMLGIKRVDLDTSDATSVTLDKATGAARVKLFVWTDGTQQPITTAYDAQL